MPSPKTVRPEDQLTCTMHLTGILGFDLETVAGREVAREKMVEAATKNIDAWLAAIEVIPGRRPQ